MKQDGIVNAEVLGKFVTTQGAVVDPFAALALPGPKHDPHQALSTLLNILLGIQNCIHQKDVEGLRKIPGWTQTLKKLELGRLEYDLDILLSRVPPCSHGIDHDLCAFLETHPERNPAYARGMRNLLSHIWDVLHEMMEESPSGA